MKNDPKYIIDTLAAYKHANKISTDWNDVYNNALNQFAQYKYTGKIYRAIRISPVDFKQRFVDSNLSIYAQIKQYLQSKKGTYRFTKNKQYAIHPSSKFISIVIEQTSVGLDIDKLLVEQYPVYNNKPFYITHAYEQEILAPITNANILTIVQPQANSIPYR